jgi:hypothetical protein
VIARLRQRVATLRPLPPPLIAAAPRLRTAIDALTTQGCSTLTARQD